MTVAFPPTTSLVAHLVGSVPLHLVGSVPLPAGTDLFIGCFDADDTAGAANRLAAAQRFAPIAP